MDDPAQLDAADPLRALRDEFHLPRSASGAPLTYLCGHSLGLQPRAAEARVREELDAWRDLGVEAHFSGVRPWVSYHEQLTQGFATLAGAHPHEVVAMNSLSVNLHLLLATFYRPTRERHKILIESGAFPSDRYAVAAQIKWHGFDPDTALLEFRPRPGEDTVREEDVCSLLEQEGSSIATVVWPGVQYLTGQRFDFAAIAAVARKKGCTFGVDLAHAIGNLPLELHASDADFAVWCGYKYLNGGPGAIGGAFVHERHSRSFDLPRLSGWWGHDPASRFAMPHEFAPQPGAAGWQVSNPPIFAMAPLLASLQLFARAGISALHGKSQRLDAFLRAALAREIHGMNILTPADPRAHGCQLSLGFNLNDAQMTRLRARLHANGVVCDWREPDVLRVAPVPMYNTFTDVSMFVTSLKSALATN